MKRALVLDVAYTNIGWAVIEPYRGKDLVIAVGDLKNPSDAKKKKTTRAACMTVDRVTHLYKLLQEVYLEWKPNCIIAEIPVGGGKSHKATEGMALGTAVATILVAQYEIPAEWTTPEEGKVAMCRCKNASKLDMQAAAMAKFPEIRKMVKKSKKSQSGYEAWFEHSADAIAAYLSARHGALVRYLADANGEWVGDSLF